MRLRGVLLAALCGSVVMSCRPASAQLDPGMLLGRWTGLSNSLAMSPEADIPAVLTLASAKNRRLQGTLEIVPCVFPIDLTVSAAGQISGGGVEDDGSRIRVQGQLRAFGDGSVRNFGDGSVRFGDGSVRIAALRFHAQMGDGSVRKGHIAVLQMLGGADWDQAAGSDVTGLWQGRYLLGDGSVRGGVTMNLANLFGGRTGGTSALGGGATFEGITDGTSNTIFGLEGTIGLPAVQNGTSRFALMGGSTDGIIAILIGLLLPAVQDDPPALQGDFMLFHSLEELFVAASRGGGGFTGGEIYLPAVQ